MYLAGHLRYGLYFIFKFIKRALKAAISNFKEQAKIVILTVDNQDNAACAKLWVIRNFNAS